MWFEPRPTTNGVQDPHCLENRLPISVSLRDRLLAWAADGDRLQLDPDREDCGFLLGRELQRELGDLYSVTYHVEYAHTDRDALRAIADSDPLPGWQFKQVHRTTGCLPRSAPPDVWACLAREGRHTREVTDRELITRIERADAAALARLPGILVDQDPSRASESRPVAGGQLVLCGPGLYVNRALAVGIDQPMSGDDLDLVEQRSAAVGVAPAIEVTDATHPGTLDLLTARGYEHDVDRDVTLLARELRGDARSLPLDGVRIVEASPELWREVSAHGFEVGVSGRADSDAWAAAVALVDDLMLIATAHDGRPLGSATVRFLGDIAVLGGMSTIPAERGRGVQSALLGYRMDAARERGCSTATTSARVGGASERNLVRHGFDPLTPKRMFVPRSRPATTVEP